VSLATVLRQESEKKEKACHHAGDHAGHNHGDHDHEEQDHSRTCCGVVQAQSKHTDLIAVIDKPLVMEVDLLR